MNPRFMILVGTAGVLAVIMAVKVSQPAPAALDDDNWSMSTPDSPPIEDRGPICDRELAGEEPAEEPEFAVQVALSGVSDKNRLDFWITEAHGYYVESFRLLIWYKEDPDMELEDASLHVEHFVENYLLANDTLKDCLEIVPAELRHVGGGMGTTENWAAEVIWYCRTRLENPDPLPVLIRAHQCE